MAGVAEVDALLAVHTYCNAHDSYDRTGIVFSGLVNTLLRYQKRAELPMKRLFSGVEFQGSKYVLAVLEYVRTRNQQASHKKTNQDDTLHKSLRVLVPSESAFPGVRCQHFLPHLQL